jgi:hypothetical protein
LLTGIISSKKARLSGQARQRHYWRNLKYNINIWVYKVPALKKALCFQSAFPAHHAILRD